MSRRRVERISSTLLGRSDGEMDCPLWNVLALDFGKAEPVATMRELLSAAGLDSPERLRPTFGAGLTPKVCRAEADLPALEVATSNSVDVLHTAFLLGLCTGVLFDPARPVLWTQASLTRRLKLYDMGGFYQ